MPYPPLGDLLGRNSPRKQRQMPCEDPFLFFKKSLDFRNENHKILDRFKVKIFF